MDTEVLKNMVLSMNEVSDCGCSEELGLVFTVTVIQQSQSRRCRTCGANGKPPTIVVDLPGEDAGYIPAFCLIRIDPPALTESTETKEELIA